MEPKTIESYKREILEKYRKDKGGEMRGYLANPTRRQIREACLWLLDKRRLKYDEQTLNRFFQFEEGKNRVLHVQQFKADKFLPIVKFLKEKTGDTGTENLELIAWLIDFRPRPYVEYLKSNNSTSGEFSIDNSEPEIVDETANTKTVTNPPPWKLIVAIGFVLVTITLTTLVLKNQSSNSQTLSPNQCMAWADTLYVEVSCATKPYSKYGTSVEPLDKMKLENFKKVEVDMATQFFAEKTNKPLIWYYKNKNGEIEYYTAPGLHPINGETLRKITPYIIQTYVPVHRYKKESFMQQ
ncbi:hypothetical protein GO009_10870 [Muricauda sp. TY007]|uniref:hypothetical protein n=1 Tax=Allomuricauda sp. TY007 TaxID=2683200 RepID=UPI0013BEE942|nr:hypothetical protein [Muricauda sp. TY007]NDV16529.1 hypothetical protein [Muricauda sp. TY007]